MTHHKQRTRAEERIAELDASPQALSAEVDSLRQQLEAAQQEAAENKAGWQRAVADFSNYRRRTDQERDAMAGIANEMLLTKVLAVADDFDRAIAAVPPELQGHGAVKKASVHVRKAEMLRQRTRDGALPARGRSVDGDDQPLAQRLPSSEIPVQAARFDRAKSLWQGARPNDAASSRLPGF